METQVRGLASRDSIRGADIFSSLGVGELDLIESNIVILDLAAGDRVFEEGGPGDALFIVLEGSIGIEKAGEDGRRKRIAEMIAGDCFGELDLLTASPRTAQAEALAESRLLRFPPPGIRLEDLMKSHPAVAAKLLRSLLAAISGRIRKANSLIKDNSPLVRELRQQVYGDKLSGLNNRTWLEETLPTHCTGPSSPMALLMLKPDNFKAINDSYGHEAGDRTIILMAAALLRLSGKTALPFRFAGNELGLILPGLGRREALAEAERVMSSLVKLDLGPIFPEGVAPDHELRLSTSIGIALYPEHGTDAVQLIAAVNELPLAGRARGGNLILFPEQKP
jgi:diguanylate cyclase (GGDEF)-like protein